MEKEQLIKRLQELPEEIALVQSEIAECQQELAKMEAHLKWLRINLEKRQNELQALLAIARLKGGQ